MSNIAFLKNVASSTRLPEGSIQDLMKRVAKLEADMSDIDKAKIDTLIADAFVSVSSHLDMIESGQPANLRNHNAPGPRYGSRAQQGNAQDRGFQLPKAAD